MAGEDRRLRVGCVAEILRRAGVEWGEATIGDRSQRCECARAAAVEAETQGMWVVRGVTTSIPRGGFFRLAAESAATDSAASRAWLAWSVEAAGGGGESDATSCLRSSREVRSVSKFCRCAGNI